MSFKKKVNPLAMERVLIWLSNRCPDTSSFRARDLQRNIRSIKTAMSAQSCIDELLDYGILKHIPSSSNATGRPKSNEYVVNYNLLECLKLDILHNYYVDDTDICDVF